MSRPEAPAPGLRRYLDILRKHKRIVVVALVAVPVVAFVYSLRQSPAYEANADVLLNRQNLAATLTGIQDPSGYQLSDRPVQTQADLARVPEVVQRTLREVPTARMSVDGFLAASSVAPKPNSDILEFTVTSGDPTVAARLASEYATQFTKYRLALDTTPARRARNQLRARIRQLRRDGDTRTALYASLTEKEQQLATYEALQTSNAYVVRTARHALQVAPRTKRNVALGVGVGVLLALALVAIAHALDTRVRTVRELEDQLGLPLLGRIGTHGSANGALIMRSAPSGVHADSYRVLRANLDFVNRTQGARVIMTTSAIEGEGKSTTVANLAIAYAREGKRVILVDLDLRRPAIARLFDVPGNPGVVDVAFGDTDLSRALRPVRLDDLGTSTLQVLPAGDEADDLEARTAASSRWEPTGSRPHSVRAEAHRHSGRSATSMTRTRPVAAMGELAASESFRVLLDDLREQSDVVFVDAPPLLATSDAITLGSIVDGIVLVTGIDRLRWQTLDDVTRALSMCSAPTLGCVVTRTPAIAEFGAYASSNGRD